MRAMCDGANVRVFGAATSPAVPRSAGRKRKHSDDASIRPHDCDDCAEFSLIIIECVSALCTGAAACRTREITMQKSLRK